MAKTAEPIRQEETRAFLKKVLGDCTDPVLLDYERKGLIVRLGRGRYSSIASAANVIRYQRELLAQRQSSQGHDVVVENAKLKIAQRQLTEHRLRLAQQETVRVADVVELWQEVLTEVRQLALSWPNKVAFALPQLTNRDVEEMRRLVRQELEDLSLRGDKVPLPAVPSMEMA